MWTARTLNFQSNGIKCNEGRGESPPFESPPVCGRYGVANLRPGRPQLAWASRHSLGTVQAEKFFRGLQPNTHFFLFCDVFGRFHSVQDRPAGEIVRIPTHSDAFFYHPLEAIRGPTLHEGMSMRQLPRWSRHIIIFSKTTGLRQDRTSKCS